MVSIIVVPLVTRGGRREDGALLCQKLATERQLSQQEDHEKWILKEIGIDDLPLG